MRAGNVTKTAQQLEVELAEMKREHAMELEDVKEFPLMNAIKNAMMGKPMDMKSCVRGTDFDNVAPNVCAGVKKTTSGPSTAGPSTAGPSTSAPSSGGNKSNKMDV